MAEGEREDLKIAVRRGFVRAIFLERTAMDIMTPYAIAIAAIVVVICSSI